MVKLKNTIITILLIACVITAAIISFPNNKIKNDIHIYIFNQSSGTYGEYQEVDSMTLISGLDFKNDTNISIIKKCANESYQIVEEYKYLQAICECVGEGCTQIINVTLNKENITQTLLNNNCNCPTGEIASCKSLSTDNVSAREEGLCCVDKEGYLVYECQDKYRVEIY